MCELRFLNIRLKLKWMKFRNVEDLKNANFYDDKWYFNNFIMIGNLSRIF